MFQPDSKLTDKQKSTAWQRINEMQDPELSLYADTLIKQLGKDRNWCDNSSTFPKNLLQLLPNIDCIFAKYVMTRNWMAVANEAWLSLNAATEKRREHALTMLMEFRKYKKMVDDGKVTEQVCRKSAHTFDCAFDECRRDAGYPSLPDAPPDSKQRGEALKACMTSYLQRLGLKGQKEYWEKMKRLHDRGAITITPPEGSTVMPWDNPDGSYPEFDMHGNPIVEGLEGLRPQNSHSHGDCTESKMCCE